MNALRYTIGFIAGIFDGLGMIRTRNRILRSVCYDGSTANGFDLSADWFAARF